MRPGDSPRELPELLRELRSAIPANDLSRATALCLTLGAAGPVRAATVLALSLLAQRLAQSAEAERPALLRAELERWQARLGPAALGEEALLVGDLYLLSGLRAEAAELLRRTCRDNPANLEAAHRLGLCELARAAATRPADVATAVARWQRALGYLTVAVTDRRHWAAWCTGRAPTTRRRLRPRCRRRRKGGSEPACSTWCWPAPSRPRAPANQPRLWRCGGWATIWKGMRRRRIC